MGENTMAIIMEKDEAHKMIDRMPPNATWDDLMREIYVREAIDRGLADSKAGRTKDVKEIRAKYGLPEWKSTGPIQLKVILTPYMLILLRIRPSMPGAPWIGLLEDLNKLANSLPQAAEFPNMIWTRFEK
jgi:hypothetical protein